MSSYADYPWLFSRRGVRGLTLTLSRPSLDPTLDTVAEIKAIREMVQFSTHENPDLEASPRIIALVLRLRELFVRNPRTFRQDQPNGLSPMEAIYTTGAFGTTAEHHGIYIGYGVVLEVSAETCASNLRPHRGYAPNLKQCFGVSRLRNFGTAVGAGQKPVFTILSADTGNAAIIDRFDRALELLREYDQGWDYNILTHNCQHATNMVVTGQNIMSGLRPLRNMFSYLTLGYGCATPANEGARVPVPSFASAAE